MCGNLVNRSLISKEIRSREMPITLSSVHSERDFFKWFKKPRSSFL